MSPAEERALIRRYQRARKRRQSAETRRICGDASEKLLLHCREAFDRLVLHYASHSRVEKDDLYGEARRGFMEGIARFDLAKDVRFWTYAHFWVEKHIKEIVTESFDRRDGPLTDEEAIGMSATGCVNKMDRFMQFKVWTEQFVARSVGATVYLVEQWRTGGARPTEERHIAGLKRLFGEDLYQHLFEPVDAAFEKSLRAVSDMESAAWVKDDPGIDRYLSAEDAGEMTGEDYFYDE